MQTASKVHVPATSLSFMIAFFHRLFVSGGSTAKGTTASVEMIDLRSASAEWEECAPMHEERCGHAMIAHNNELLVFGGENGTRYLASCER